MVISSRKIRIVLAMLGLDCHDRGLVYLASGLRDAGMEVIYLGRFNTPENIVKTAIEEDADVIGVSHLVDHLYMMYFPQIMELLKKKDASDICVVGGGRIADEDKPELEKLGITGLFEGGTPMEKIAQHIEQRVRQERWKES